MKELLSSIVTEMSVLGVYKASRPGTSKWSVANHSHRSFYFGLPGLPSKLLLETKGLEIGDWKLEWDLTASSYLRTLFSGHGLGGSPFCVFSLSFSRLTDSRVYFLSFLSLHRRIGDAVAFDRVAEDHHVAPGTSYCAG